MTTQDKEQFEAFARKHMNRIIGDCFLRDCNDVDPQRTYEKFETEDAWLDWQAALASQPRISESELVDLISQYMWERNGATVTFKGNVTGCAKTILAKFPQIKEGV